MLSNRLGPGGQPLPPGAPGIPGSVVQQPPSSIPPDSGVGGPGGVQVAPGVPPGARMQMMNQGPGQGTILYSFKVFDRIFN